MEEVATPNIAEQENTMQPPVQEKSKKKLVIAIMVVLILAILAVTTYILLNPKAEDQPDTNQDDTQEDSEDEDNSEDEQIEDQEQNNTPEDNFSTSDFKEFSFSVSPLLSYRLDIIFNGPAEGKISDYLAGFQGKEFKSTNANFQIVFPYEYSAPKAINYIDFEEFTNLGSIANGVRIKLESNKYRYVTNFDPTKDCTGMGPEVTKAPCIGGALRVGETGVFFECQSEDVRYCDEMLSSMTITRKEVEKTSLEFKMSESVAPNGTTQNYNLFNISIPKADLSNVTTKVPVLGDVSNYPSDIYSEYKINSSKYTFTIGAGTEFFISEIEVVSEMGKIGFLGEITIVKHRAQENSDLYFFIHKSNISNENLPADGVYGEREAPLATTTIKGVDKQFYVTCEEKIEGGLEECKDIVKSMSIGK